jgi:hypothetical protein
MMIAEMDKECSEEREMINTVNTSKEMIQPWSD